MKTRSKISLVTACVIACVVGWFSVHQAMARDAPRQTKAVPQVDDAVAKAIEQADRITQEIPFDRISEIADASIDRLAANYPNLPLNREYAPTPENFQSAYLDGLRKEAAAGRLRCDQPFSQSLAVDLAYITQVECRGQGGFRIEALFPKGREGIVEIEAPGTKIQVSQSNVGPSPDFPRR